MRITQRLLYWVRKLIVIHKFAMGKGLQNKIKNKFKHASGAEQRKKQAAQHGKEWDIRVTIDEDYTAKLLIKKLDDASDKILWYLVGGEELGKAREQAKEVDPYTLEAVLPYAHHHVCLILKDEASYRGVCKMLGTIHRVGKYVALRDPSYTYAGWIIHATKIKTKTDETKRQVKEYGTRPVDIDNEENERKIRYMIQKYGDTEAKLSIGIVPRCATEVRNKKRKERQDQRDRLKKKQKLDKLKEMVAKLEKDLE